MDLIFAKWIFISSLQLTAGAGLDWPVMPAAALPSSGITQAIAIEDVWVPGVECPPTEVGAPPSTCVPTPGGFVSGGPRLQLFCVDRGVYRVDLRLGLKATGLAEVEGKVWLLGPGGDSTLLVEFYADPKRATFQATSVAVAAETDACYRIRYDSTGPAWINPDPRVTSLIIHRAGQ